MSKPNFTVRFVKDSQELERLSKILTEASAFSLDIETTDWWNRHRERIALIQIAFRNENRIRVAVIDALAELNIESLRAPLEQSSALKIIHNASFDAVRLDKHFGFTVAPVFDTMTAARRSGEKKYSLKAQAEIHLNLPLDKTARASDWSRRPLAARQLHYAALDAYAALLLYENQSKRGLNADYRLRPSGKTAQILLPIGEALSPAQVKTETTASPNKDLQSNDILPELAAAILGIVAELPSRYNPDGLATSIGAGRVGLTGWIIDRRLGANAEPDEETVKMTIGDLCERELIRITQTRRMEATEKGSKEWRKLKDP